MVIINLFKKMKTKIVILIFFFSSLPFLVKAQSLANSNSKLDARLNKEKIFAETQRKTFNITSWAGANITELISKWGNFTEKMKRRMVTSFTFMKQDIPEMAENMNLAILFLTNLEILCIKKQARTIRILMILQISMIFM